MFRRRPRSKNSYMFCQSSSSRSSDIVRPNNTSLIVNESDSDSDELPKELTSVLTEVEEMSSTRRKSSSLMKSLSQRSQSTPITQANDGPKKVLKEINQNIEKKNVNEKLKSPVKAVNSKPEKKISFFIEVIQACGASPLPGNSSFVMSEDQTMFSIKVNNKLKGNANDTQLFIKSLEKELENPDQLQKMLAHTLTSEDCNVARGPVQDPMMRMLLMVECVQTELIDLVIQKVSDIIIDGNEGESSQLVSPLLGQLRFLSRNKEAKISDKLFEIIQVAPVNVQREIIFMMPEIVIEDEMEEVSLQLVDMLKYDMVLTHVIVDAITNLPLKKSIQSQVRMKLLNHLDKCHGEFLPSLVQFILHKFEVDEIQEILISLRENLPFSVEHSQIQKASQTSEDSYIKLTFEILKFSAMASKPLTDAWLKIISGLKSSSDFRCVDFIMLIIMYTNLHGRKNQILSIIRSKIKSSVLTDVCIENTFKILLVIAKEYYVSVLEVASALLKSFEQVVAEFGVSLFRACFANFNHYMEQTVVNELLIHIGTGLPSTVNMALTALKSLSESDKESLARHTLSIMGLLIKLQDLDVIQVRLLIDVIADLIFFNSEQINSGWQDELQIFIRKQLSSSKIEFCKKGIVAAVMFGKHGGMLEENESFNHKQIHALLEIARRSNSEVKGAFFNDEFATMSQKSALTKSFLKFWSENISNWILDNLFVRDIDLECEHFPMSLQYILETEGERQLVFPVVDFITSAKSNKPLNIPVTVIPSALRLLWSCEENMDSILPILCASVIMPEITVFDNFQVFEENQKTIILDCLFLCANYLIECVNAFSARGKLDKALIRLKQLISLRRLIGRVINRMHNYIPPYYQFHIPVPKIVKKKNEKTVKKGRKRKADGAVSENKNDADAESQLPGTMAMSCTNVEIPQLVVEREGDEESLHIYEGYFRQLQFNCFALLNTNLRFSSNGANYENEIASVFYNENCWSSRCREKLELETCDALFLLEDYIQKSEQVLRKTKRFFNLKGKTNFSDLEDVSPEKFIEQTFLVLPKLLKKVEIWSSYCEDLLKANEGIYDGPGMYPKDARDIKLALASTLKLIAEILSWQGFQKANNKQLLRDVLIILSNKKISRKESLKVEPINSLAREASNYLAGFSHKNLVLSGGISIVKAVQACISYASTPEHNKTLAELCLSMLYKPWFTVHGSREKGSIYNQHIDFLIRTYFSKVDNKLEVVRTTAKLVLDEMSQFTSKDSNLETFRSVNKSNFPMLFRAMCEGLVLAASAELSTVSNDQDRLQIWNTVVETMLIFVNIVKIHSSRVNLAALLRRSQAIIELFFSEGMPAVESGLRVNAIGVLNLLKSFQSVTRFLHSICCHSKITSDSLVATYVPSIRAQCERLTLEVKGMLILNKIPMDCITIATLKNKDLKGNDILSQETTYSDSDEDSELPPEAENEEGEGENSMDVS